MVLCYDSLLRLKKEGYGVIDAPDEAYQSASIDVTLGNSFKIPIMPKNIYFAFPCTGDEFTKNNQLIYQTLTPIKRGDEDRDYCKIEPHGFVLATTNETVKLHRGIGAWIEGRSSIGRSGVFIQNAGWINPGFEGQITLELYNANHFPIYIYSGMGIGQIIIEQLDSKTSKPYKGKYNNQLGTTPPIFIKEES